MTSPAEIGSTARKPRPAMPLATPLRAFGVIQVSATRSGYGERRRECVDIRSSKLTVYSEATSTTILAHSVAGNRPSCGQWHRRVEGPISTLKAIGDTP